MAYFDHVAQANNRSFHACIPTVVFKAGQRLKALGKTQSRLRLVCALNANSASSIQLTELLMLVCEVKRSANLRLIKEEMVDSVKLDTLFPNKCI